MASPVKRYLLLINPKLLNYSRFLLKNSEFQFIPSLLKEKQFNDAIKGLTVFVEEKDEGNKFKNIFLGKIKYHYY